jgi:PhzF family phenazine biosynthesis protein
VSTGREQLIIPLTSTEAVIRARPQPDRLAELRSAEGASMAYVFASLQQGRLLARFFFPQGPAVLEDPATGSATANLGGWCLALGHELPRRFEIEQGEQTGRPSLLYLEIDEARRIRVRGDVVELGCGTIDI